MTFRLVGALALVLTAIGIGGAVWFFTQSDLDDVHASIALNYPNVDHVDADDFAKMQNEDTIVFDVREPQEFAVSHLPGAVLVDPKMSADEFEALFANDLNGKTAVFYCSVGVRSSMLADRVAAIVEAQTSQAPINLKGGLFQWRNDGRGLVSEGRDPTQHIHPFDDTWGRLIEDKNAIRYTVPAS